MVSRFLVVGDATLDVTVAPSRPLRDGGDVPAVIRIGPGGQGANVAVRLARAGASAQLAAALAEDASGRLLAESLAADGVAVLPLPTPRSPVVVALLDPRGERSMLSDRQPLASAEALAHAAETADWVHVSAYALLDEAEAGPIAGAVAKRPPGARLSVAGGSIPTDPATVDRFRARLAGLRPDLVAVSRDEAGALLGGPSAGGPRAAAARLAGLASIVVVTAGLEGSVATHDGHVEEVPAAEARGPVLDETGSGDGYLAALLRALAAGAWPPSPPTLREAMLAGSRCGALVARVVGAQAPIPGEREGAA